MSATDMRVCANSLAPSFAAALLLCQMRAESAWITPRPWQRASAAGAAATPPGAQQRTLWPWWTRQHPMQESLLDAVSERQVSRRHPLFKKALPRRGLEDTDLSATNARQRRELVPKPTPSGRCAARVEEEGSQEAPVTGADSEGSRGGLSPMAQGWGMENADL